MLATWLAWVSIEAEVAARSDGFWQRFHTETNVHAIPLEMTQSSYMEETLPFAYRPDLAAAFAADVGTYKTAKSRKQIFETRRLHNRIRLDKSMRFDHSKVS